MNRLGCRLVHGQRMQLSILLFLLLLGMATTSITDVHAITYDLTGTGLGLAEGNYGTTLVISPELSLSGLTGGNEFGYPTGLPGTIFVHSTNGIGLKDETGKGSKGVSGRGVGNNYEALILDFLPHWMPSR